MATRQRQRRRPTGGYYTGTDRQPPLPTPRRGRRRPPPGQREATESRDRARQRSVENTQQQEIALDLAQLTLDITGILDPTPLSDGTNMLISLTRGKWTDALISGVSLLPYLGDLAKLAKLRDYSDTVRLAKQIAKTDPAWRRVLREMFTPLKALLDNVAKTGADTLPTKVLSGSGRCVMRSMSFWSGIPRSVVPQRSRTRPLHPQSRFQPLMARGRPRRSGGWSRLMMGR